MAHGYKMKIREWFEKRVLGLPGEAKNGIVEKTIDFKDIQTAISEIKGSTDAVERVIDVLEMKGHKVRERIKIDAGTWRAYVVYTDLNGYLVTFKRNWLWNFGKMFNRPEKEGTGLNMHLARYCQLNNIKTLLIVRGDGMIYSVGIDDLYEYAVTHNTIREEKSSFEAHIPTTLLKIFTIKQEGGTGKDGK